MTSIVCLDEVDGATFGILFTATLLSSWVAGSTYQWVVEKGLFRKDFLQKENQYNVLVGISALTANLQAIGCFLNAVLLEDDDNNDSYGLTTVLSINMLLMTHSSLALVAWKVSLTFPNAEQTWQRLLYINFAMLPVSFMGSAIWATSHQHPDRTGWQYANNFSMPLSIALWGLAEAILSSVFVYQMARYQWAPVQHKALGVSTFVALCDVICMILAVHAGDLTAMCLWGLLYSVRVRLEIRVVSSMIEYLQTKRAQIMYTDSLQQQNSRRRKRRRRKRSRNKSSSKEDDESDCQSMGSASHRSIMSHMSLSKIMVYPNDLTQLFKSDFFSNVLNPGFVAKSLRSLASLAKRSLGGCGGNCPKCGKPILMDDITLGSIQSRNSKHSLKHDLAGDFCSCFKGKEKAQGSEEKTSRTFRGSSSMFVSPPMTEIRVDSLISLEIRDDDDDDSDSSPVISITGAISTSGMSDVANFSQQLSHKHLMGTLNHTSHHGEAKESEEPNNSSSDSSEGDNRSKASKLVAYCDAVMENLSAYNLTSEEESSLSSREEGEDGEGDNDDNRSKASRLVRYCDAVMENLSAYNLTSEEESSLSSREEDEEEDDAGDSDDDNDSDSDETMIAEESQLPAASSPNP